MPVINSSTVEEVIKAIRNTPAITSLLAKDINAITAVRPENFEPTGVLFPQLTVAYEESKSNSIIPSTYAHLRIIAWCLPEQTQPYKFLKSITDSVLLLFNRKGSQFDNVDIPSDTGVNFNQFVKISSTHGYEPTLRKQFSETIFLVVSGENQSYNPANSGNQPWV